MRSQRHHLLAQSPLGSLPPEDRLPRLLRQGADHFLGRVKRSWPLLGRLPPPPVWRSSSLPGSHNLLRQAHPKGALHSAYVRKLSLLQALKEHGVLPVTGVSHHHLKRHTPLPTEVHQRMCYLGLAPKVHLIRYVRLFTQLTIFGPTLRQIQLSANWPVQRT